MMLGTKKKKLTSFIIKTPFHTTKGVGKRVPAIGTPRETSERLLHVHSFLNEKKDERAWGEKEKEKKTHNDTSIKEYRKEYAAKSR